MKQIKINIFDKITKKLAKDISSNYNDVEYFNIENVENKYQRGILILWDIRNKKMTENSKLTINNKLDFIISEISVIKSDIVEIKKDVADLKKDVAQLKIDVADLKKDVEMLKSFHTEDIKSYLRNKKNGDRSRSWTCDPKLRRLVLYPLSYATIQFLNYILLFFIIIILQSIQSIYINIKRIFYFGKSKVFIWAMH